MSITKPVVLLIVSLSMVGCTSTRYQSTPLKLLNGKEIVVPHGTLTIKNDTPRRVDITNALERVTFVDANGDGVPVGTEMYFDIVPLGDRLRPVRLLPDERRSIGLSEGIYRIKYRHGDEEAMCTVPVVLSGRLSLPAVELQLSRAHEGNCRLWAPI